LNHAVFNTSPQTKDIPSTEDQQPEKEERMDLSLSSEWESAFLSSSSSSLDRRNESPNAWTQYVTNFVRNQSMPTASSASSSLAEKEMEISSHNQKNDHHNHNYDDDHHYMIALPINVQVNAELFMELESIQHAILYRCLLLVHSG
jgi:hypothetical protein